MEIIRYIFILKNSRLHTMQLITSSHRTDNWKLGWPCAFLYGAQSPAQAPVCYKNNLYWRNKLLGQKSSNFWNVLLLWFSWGGELFYLSIFFKIFQFEVENLIFRFWPKPKVGVTQPSKENTTPPKIDQKNHFSDIIYLICNFSSGNG